MSGRSLNHALSGLAAAVLLVGLSGCSGGSLPKIKDLNPFAEKQKPLPGKRIAVLPKPDHIGGELATGALPVTLPPPQINDSWTQPGGVASNAPGHLALGAALKRIWTADAGRGSSSDGRLTARPIVSGGRIFTLDASGVVSAFSAASGTRAWRVGLSPSSEKSHEGYGGGLAAANGRLFAATGFGTVVALDPRSGKKVWEKNVGVPVRASPTVDGGKVFVATTEGRLYCFSEVDGAELWSFRGLPERTSILSNQSPAVAGDTVVVPYPSGDLVAIRISDGQSIWSESLSRTRARSSLASLSDTARPAIAGGTVYAVGHAGRMIATAATSGERLWSLNVPGIQTPWVAGQSIYVVDVRGQLMSLTRKDGKIRWTVKLPGAKTWSGPVLAGSRLWLASSKGHLVSVDPTAGRVLSTRNLGTPVYIAPIVAGGRMYVLTDKARLIALR